ncbi:hypothetical protein [Geobacillus stearothermophilus]|uniref:hypothetical protein n=1 Tax=Geobacillus stearothermophilus TaxID=1422 RepID=UPI00066FEE9A|nr:hypothetical protein [Geobacillus stearothermophilus]KMY58077.1 hypothetical protein AA905_13805 [Geobacillus stearothermophilus]KMY59885.1 hypothetical protein AA904_09820 [Geobacillus stearothermophilus]
MFKILKVLFSFVLIFIIFLNTFEQVDAASRSKIYDKGEWTVYYDSPDNAKTYPHLHFYKSKKHIYCLRLDNLEACDSTGKNENKVPNSVKKEVMKHSKVQSALKKYNPSMFSSNVLKKLKPLIVAGAAVGVVIAAANIFTGAVDDVAAWAALSAALKI